MSSSVYPDPIYQEQDLPEAIELTTIHAEFASLWCNRNVQRKGKMYFCPVGSVVSAGSSHPQQRASITTPLRRLETKEAQVVAPANKAQRHVKENDRSHESFLRIVFRSLPFLAFILLATRISEIASWSLKEKSVLLVLIVGLFALSVYAWWPRNRQ